MDPLYHEERKTLSLIPVQFFKLVLARLNAKFKNKQRALLASARCARYKGYNIDLGTRAMLPTC